MYLKRLKKTTEFKIADKLPKEVNSNIKKNSPTATLRQFENIATNHILSLNKDNVNTTSPHDLFPENTINNILDIDTYISDLNSVDKYLTF